MTSSGKLSNIVVPTLSTRMTPLQQICTLDVYKETHPYRMTNIICTVGPSCDSVETLSQMIEHGMNICRFNLAHADHEYHAKILRNLHEAVSQSKQKALAEVATAVDISGPGIRIGQFKQDMKLPLKLVSGQRAKFSSEASLKDSMDAENIYVEQSFISRAEVGNQVFIEYGPLSFEVLEKDETSLTCVVVNPGEIKSHQPCHIPRSLPCLQPQLTDKDKQDLAFAVEHNVDIVLVSWVWSPEFVAAVKAELGKEVAARVKVIAKIENYQGVKSVDEILKVADGIMVARGDLGIDIPPEKVFLAQKMMIARANRAGKPVICASQMLESMVTNARPTRAEASDVANAILDGADCVMLSKETAIGRYPVSAVKTLNSVCQEAENAVYHAKAFTEIRNVTPLPTDKPRATAIAAVEAALRCHASAIVVITSSGRSAMDIAQYRPHCVVIAVTKSIHTARCLNLYRGVFSVVHTGASCDEWYMDVDMRIHYALQRARERGYVKTGETAILVTGFQSGPGFTNTVRSVRIPPEEHKPHYLNLPGTMRHLGVDDPASLDSQSDDDLDF
ncbi:pyruvate kinase PKM [Aplysia californica]|uniref:Pyruvate kinase n=1 Tax=Aplysia californica TaxID=6500 RepID=A0ABM0JX35_APLCA|nr:pyruvate kinase PKM [Aplysia californica]